MSQLLVAILVLAVVGVYIRTRLRRGLLYVGATFRSLLEAGQYWIWTPSRIVSKVDVRPRIVAVPGQEVLTADGIAVKASLVAQYRVTDPVIAVNAQANYESGLYTELQLAIRRLISAESIDSLLEKRPGLAAQLTEAAKAGAARLGVELLQASQCSEQCPRTPDVPSGNHRRRGNGSTRSYVAERCDAASTWARSARMRGSSETTPMFTWRRTPRAHPIAPHLIAAAAIVALFPLSACTSGAPKVATSTPPPQRYEYAETQKLVTLVTDAAKLIETEGEAAFAKLRAPGSRWRQQDSYVFVVDLQGVTRVHPDAARENRDESNVKDVNGRPVIRGTIQAATAVPGKRDGWYHYEWQVPGGLLPRWKSTYARLAESPLGTRYVVASGMYNDRMERPFVVDLVQSAVGQIEKRGEDAFPLLRDRTGPFIAKDAYIFVIDPATGVELVNPAFPNLEGRNVLDVKDTQGKLFVREMLDLAKTRGSGWVSYMWPKPGEAVSTQKSTYVTRANVGEGWLLVAAGVYLADAPKSPVAANKLRAPELQALVREAATVLERRGAAAFPELQTKGSRWFTDDTYLIVWTMDGTRAFHAADHTIEGRDASDVTDALGRPYGRMFLDVARSPSGEGWVHYMYPEPGSLFPSWKSTFVKRVAFPDGKPHLVASGIYNMQMDSTFIADVVDRAAALIEKEGTRAFDILRDRKGPFVFMDTYVFVETSAGVSVVNPGQPSLEGTNLIDVRDVNGKTLVRDYIDGALKKGAVWEEYRWYRPGYDTPFRKRAYVRRVQVGNDTYVVGSGYYVDR